MVLRTVGRRPLKLPERDLPRSAGNMRRMLDGPLPRRVWVVGPTGAGKSLLADTLAGRLGVQATHLDDLHWAPGWVERPWDDLERRVAPIVAGDVWVVDGNYSRVRGRFADRVELYVWLDLPFRVTFPRVFRRAMRRCLRGELCCNGNRETLFRTFLTRHSILLWSIRTRFTRPYGFAGEFAMRPHVRLRSAQEVEAFLAAAWNRNGPDARASGP
jgi:adenylate kinase family enzyme